MPPLRDATVAMPDGRRLAYTEWGVPDGKPVLFFHGTPGSGMWCPDEQASVDARVRLIAPDRPGIGRSDNQEGRTIGAWAEDAEALANALQISTFGVVGVSAGATYGLACAALNPARLTGVALVSSRVVSKYDWEERPDAALEWSDDERGLFELARHDPTAAADLAAEQYARDVEPREDLPNRVRKALETAEGDRWFFQDPSRAEIFDASLRETWRQGPSAFKWEFIDVFQPWGFRLADIAIPVTIFHGAQDPWVTQEHLDFQMRTIPNASLVVWPDCGHLGFAKHWREILEAVT